MGLKDRLVDLIYEKGCIKYGDFTLTSGRKSHYKIELDPLFEDEEGREVLGELGSRELEELERKNKKEYGLSGVNTGGTFFGGFVSKKVGRDLVNVDYKRDLIIGNILPKEYVIFEDVTTTGGSILECVKMLREKGCEIYNSIVVVNRQEGSEYNLSRQKIKLSSILKREEIF